MIFMIGFCVGLIVGVLVVAGYLMFAPDIDRWD